MRLTVVTLASARRWISVAGAPRFIQSAGDGETGIRSAGVESPKRPRYVNKGEIDRAIADCNEAIRLEPKQTPAYAYRGVAYEKKGDPKNAKVDFETALSLPVNNFPIDGRLAHEMARTRLAALSVAGTAQAPKPPAIPPPAADCSRAETHWKSAEDIKTLAVYEDHLARFPTCDFATLATARIEALKKK
ncbi:MAG: tetratricopeptide repeat protein [Xanthobacteraceae bacterium]